MTSDIRGEQLIAAIGRCDQDQDSWGLQPIKKSLVLLYRMLRQPLCWKSSY